jgi:hypothetical protein
LPSLCYAKRNKWVTAVKWAKNGGKYVMMRFWLWDGQERNAELRIAEDESIEVMG